MCGPALYQQEPYQPSVHSSACLEFQHSRSWDRRTQSWKPDWATKTSKQNKTKKILNMEKSNHLKLGNKNSNNDKNHNYS